MIIYLSVCLEWMSHVYNRIGVWWLCKQVCKQDVAQQDATIPGQFRTNCRVRVQNTTIWCSLQAWDHTNDEILLPESTKVTSVKARKLDSWIPLFTLLSCTPGNFHRFHYLIIAGSVGKVKPTSLTKEWGDTLGYMLGSSSKKLEPATIPVILPMNPAILPTSTDINPHLVVVHSLVARALPSTKEDLLQGDNAAPGVKMGEDTMAPAAAFPWFLPLVN